MSTKYEICLVLLHGYEFKIFGEYKRKRHHTLKVFKTFFYNTKPDFHVSSPIILMINWTILKCRNGETFSAISVLHDEKTGE